MKLFATITINAIILIGVGLAFTLYAPLTMALFTIPDISGLDTLSYWNIAAFVRLFGAALFGYGLLLWSVRSALKQSDQANRRGFLYALFLANLLAVIVSFTQQIVVWQIWIGWILFGFFCIFLLTYGYFLFFPSKTDTANPG